MVVLILGHKCSGLRVLIQSTSELYRAGGFGYRGRVGLVACKVQSMGERCLGQLPERNLSAH